MQTHRLKIDMYAGGSSKQVIMLSQRDTNARIVMELFASKGLFNIEQGTTAKVAGKNAEGYPVQTNAILDVSNMTAMIDVPKAMTEAPGRGIYEIILTKSGKELRSRNIQIIVERAA